MSNVMLKEHTEDELDDMWISDLVSLSDALYAYRKRVLKHLAQRRRMGL